MMKWMPTYKLAKLVSLSNANDVGALPLAG